MQHGQEIKITKNDVQFLKWYDLKERVRNSKGFVNPEEFNEMLESSIALQLRSDVPVGVCLSGGIDSSSIVSILYKKFNNKDIKTFSSIYDQGSNGDESEYLEEYKPFLTNMFFTKPDESTLIDDLEQFVKAQSEPLPSTSPYAQFKVMELAR